jgi:hypothetical protein
MQKIFLYDSVNNRVELNVPEILLVREFEALMDNKRNITPKDKKGEHGERAFKEFKYIWLALDWLSPYSDYAEQERHQQALKDSGLTEDEFNDPIFRAACRKYRALQEETRSIKMLKAAQNTVDKFIDYFNNIDPEERDLQTGRPIYKVKDIMAEISSLSKVNGELKDLESQVMKEKSEESTLRAGAKEGFVPVGF